MARKKTDPLSGLARSLDDETAAVEKRFSDADRVTAGKAARPPQLPRRTIVRDTFSFPRGDHDLIAELRHRCFSAGFSATKSELVRAGLHALAAMPAPTFANTIAGVEKLKPGPVARRKSREDHNEGREKNHPPGAGR